MSKITLQSLIAVVMGLGTLTSCAEKSVNAEQQEREMTPTYLYKIITLEDWNKSQNQPSVVVAGKDKDFIHLAKEDQVQRIVDKYWASIPEYVILKIDTKKLPGNLVYEANPGGTNKYYHLYGAPIPLKAVIEGKKVKK